MYVLAIFLPLLASIFAGILTFLKHKNTENAKNYDFLAQIITSGALIISALIATYTFIGMITSGYSNEVIKVLDWVESGNVNIDWSLKVDTLSVVMVFVVTVVSAMVHIYSVGYMSHDKSIARFQSYLSLFTFGMLMLVTSDNLVQLFFGWEAVGLCSYLLIGFWYHKPSANSASMKAFLVNRVGDFGFSLGIFAAFMLFKDINLDNIFANAVAYKDVTWSILGLQVKAITVICLLLFIGAMGKSAQLGLHVWLPDAMEGPTPVSALIHAATMVTAGVFLVARMSPLYELSIVALSFVTIIGALTAIFAASIGIVQNDIKRIIAFSTCSQLGYMFFALGVSAYQGAMFHLTTHAFFKALLFLGAGSVIHALHEEQDIRNMGGMAKKIPITTAFMYIGSFALAGIYPFAGFYSKDFILEAAWASGGFLGSFSYIIGVLAAFLTAFYSFRLLILVFEGKHRCDDNVYEKAHESPMVMILPMGVLFIGAIVSGFMLKEAFIGHDYPKFWGEAILDTGRSHDVMHAAHGVSSFIKYFPFAISIFGIAMAYVFYKLQPALPTLLAQRFAKIYQLLLNKYYFDELYDKVFIKPALRFGTFFWKKVDQGIIDKFGPDGLASLTAKLSQVFSKFQSGYLTRYALVMVFGLVFMLTVAFVGGM